MKVVLPVHVFLEAEGIVAHVDGVERRVSRAILSGIYGADKVKCTGCGVTLSAHHGGANDV